MTEYLPTEPQISRPVGCQVVPFRRKKRYIIDWTLTSTHLTEQHHACFPRINSYRSDLDLTLLFTFVTTKTVTGSLVLSTI